jgi:hypothetical protein
MASVGLSLFSQAQTQKVATNDSAARSTKGVDTLKERYYEVTDTSKAEVTVIYLSDDGLVHHAQGYVVRKGWARKDSKGALQWDESQTLVGVLDKKTQKPIKRPIQIL